jgi:hypothetical protein
MIEIHDVANRAQASSDFILSRLLPDGRKIGSEWTARNPLRDDRTPGSFKVNTLTGQWGDFATGDKGGDLVSLYAYLHSTSQLEAAKELDALIGNTPAPATKPSKPIQIVEAPDHKQAARLLATSAMDQGYKPAAIHTYTDVNGAPLFWRVRLKHDDGSKRIFPMRPEGSGRYGKAEPQFQSNQKPIYAIGTLTKRPDATVWVVEGEGCADALRLLKITATTSGGATSANSADWSPLSGRDVVIWPDNDSEGTAYQEAVINKLQGIARSIRTVEVSKLGLADKGDCVDWLEANPNATAELIAQLPTIEATKPAAEVLGVLDVPTPDHWSDPEPLPELPEVHSFNPEFLPQVLRDYVGDISERMQCPPDFTAATCMAMVSSAIGRQISIRPKRVDSWAVVPNLWAMIVGRSGIMKSPAMSAALAPLRRMQSEAFEAHEIALRDHEVVAKLNKLKSEADSKKASGLVKNGRFDDAQDLLANSISAFDEPSVRRYLVNDSTVEALAETLEENPNGVLVDRDELAGWLKSLDKDGQQEARAFYLTAADGDKGFTTDRIGRGRGKHIPAVCVSIVGGIQPGVLAYYVRDTQKQGSGDDGLLQRFGVMVYPDVSKQWHNIDRPPNKQAQEAVNELIQNLCNLDLARIGAEHDPYQPIPFLRFNSVAQELFDEWRGDLEKRLRGDEEHPAIVSHLSKYRKLVPSLALINHLCGNGTGQVSERSLMRALEFSRYLESHAMRVYSYASRPDVDGAKTILAKFRAGKLPERFAVRDVYKAGWSGLATPDEARAPIRLLTEYGYLRELKPENLTGRPTQQYEAHPSLRRSA